MKLAIDFGTSNSLLMAVDQGQIIDKIPIDATNLESPNLLRTIMYFPNAKEVFYGHRAIAEYTERDFQGRFIRSIKRQLPSRQFVGTYIDNRPLNLEDIIALFLRELKKRAETFLGKTSDTVVLGRPAKFSLIPEDDHYAQYRLERAAREAGFKTIHFMPEPVASAYEIQAELKQEKLLLVVDLGGGTSDFTLVRLRPEGFSQSDVLSIGGVPVAGDALDGAVMRQKLSPYFGSKVEYKVPFGSNIIRMPKTLVEQISSAADLTTLRERDMLDFFRNVRKWSVGGEDGKCLDRLFTLIEDNLGFELFERIEKTKVNLSAANETTFDWDYPTIEMKVPVTASEFDQMTESEVSKIFAALDDTLALGQINPKDVDLISLTGGTAKVPVIARELERRFGKEKLLQRNPFQSVVRGLAEFAKTL